MSQKVKNASIHLCPTGGEIQVPPHFHPCLWAVGREWVIYSPYMPLLRKDVSKTLGNDFFHKKNRVKNCPSGTGLRYTFSQMKERIDELNSRKDTGE